MEYIMIEPSTDFATLNEESIYVFFSGSERKFFQIKQNKETKFLVDEISQGIYMTELEEKAKRFNLDLKKVLNYLGFFYDSKLIKIDDIKSGYDHDKHAIPELWSNERYGYQILYLKERYPKFSQGKSNNEIQKLFSNYKITIVGMGSPGSMLAIWFAAMGVGTLNLIDGDKVELSNLMRQFFYMESDIGQKKTDCIKRYINRFNKEVNVASIPEYVTAQNKNKIFPKSNLIIQTADKPAGLIDIYVDEGAEKLNVPSLYMHNQSIGPLVIPNKTKNMRDFYDQYNLETDGMFYKEINNFDSRSKTAYPTIIHGVIPLTCQLLDFVVEYIVTQNLTCLENSMWYEFKNEFKSF